MNNLVQELINQNPTDWARVLEHDYKIKITCDGDVASLRYDQIESPMHEPIVQQCRGMVVDTVRRRVVAWPYNKFWNHGEALAAPVDWATARVQEKLDGSLMILYWRDAYDGWCVASSGHPSAGGSFGSDERTFREAFWQVARGGALWHPATDTRITYMFELCDAPNRVVVRHDEPRLVLHGARFLDSGEELSPAALVMAAADMHCELAREFGIGSIADCLAAADALDPIQQEGFVVVDAQFRRVKIKSPRYVILHHMKGEATVRRAIELWQTGEAGELLAHFPEMRAGIQPVHDALDNIATQAVQDFEANRAHPSRKAFALAVKDRPWAVVLFRMLSDGHTLDDAKAIMRRQTTSTLERMVSP
jgi:hypothetical protein